jgi:hypothetical protein
MKKILTLMLIVALSCPAWATPYKTKREYRVKKEKVHRKSVSNRRSARY